MLELEPDVVTLLESDAVILVGTVAPDGLPDIRPAVGVSSSAISLSSVLFPQPDGPIRATNSPSPTCTSNGPSAAKDCLPRPSVRRR